MPVLSGSLEPTGPLAGLAVVDTQVGVRASRVQSLRRAGQSVPTPVATRAILDTGSGVTLADAALLRSLGLTVSITQIPIMIPSPGSNLVNCSLFDVSLTVLHPLKKPRLNLVFASVPVLEAALSSFAALGVQVIIGCDALARCLFSYNGVSGTFTLAY